MKTSDQEARRFAATLRNANVFEWELANVEQNRRDRENLSRGLAWATLLSTIFWGACALWWAL